MNVAYKRAPGTPITTEQRRQLEALAKMPDSEIDTSDIPVLPESAWKNAVRGRFYRPVKQAVSLRLDADVLAWLKKDGDGYQTRANQILRERMVQSLEVSSSEATANISLSRHIEMELAPPRCGRRQFPRLQNRTQLMNSAASFKLRAR